MVYVYSIAQYLNGNYKTALNYLTQLIESYKKETSLPLSLSELTYTRGITNYYLDNFGGSKFDIQSCLSDNVLNKDYLLECQRLLFLLDLKTK